MKKIIDHIRQADKRRLLIYLFSFVIYRVINNLFSNSVLYLLNEESFRERWTANSIPCGDTPHVFLILFQVFKIMLFLMFIRLAKKNANGLLCEFFIAYFIYDLVYILSFIWNLIPLPFSFHTWWVLISSGQIFLKRYLPYLDLIFAGLWTAALFIVLHKRNKLSFMFLINRLILIPISVPLVSWIIYLVRRLL